MASSQWTIPKFVRRVKDWASCFLACRTPLDEDGVINKNENTMNNNNNLTFKRIKRKMKSTKKKRSERKLSLSQLIYGDQGVGETEKNNSLEIKETEQEQNDKANSCQETKNVSSNVQKKPGDDDEEESGFIVLCFDREDGGFDVVIEGKQEKKENDKANSCQETKNVSSNVQEKPGDDDEEEDIDASDISSGSNRSEEGRRSFAFPILEVEWMGSPVKMPESYDLSPKKQKPVALGFQCCRF